MSTRHPQEYYAQAYEKTIQMRKEGKLLRQIAATLELPEATVGYWLRKGRKSAPLTVTEAALQDALKIIEGGGSYAEASRATGITAAYLGRKFPGKGWTKEMALECAHQARRMQIDYDLDKYLK